MRNAHRYTAIYGARIAAEKPDSTELVSRLDGDRPSRTPERVRPYARENAPGPLAPVVLFDYDSPAMLSLAQEARGSRESRARDYPDRVLLLPLRAQETLSVECDRPRQPAIHRRALRALERRHIVSTRLCGPRYYQVFVYVGLDRLALSDTPIHMEILLRTMAIVVTCAIAAMSFYVLATARHSVSKGGSGAGSRKG
jgi:hypothetical protein